MGIRGERLSADSEVPSPPCEGKPFQRRHVPFPWATSEDVGLPPSGLTSGRILGSLLRKLGLEGWVGHPGHDLWLSPAAPRGRHSLPQRTRASRFPVPTWAQPPACPCSGLGSPPGRMLGRTGRRAAAVPGQALLWGGCRAGRPSGGLCCPCTVPLRLVPPTCPSGPFGRILLLHPYSGHS